MAQHHFRHYPQHSKTPELIYHLTYNDAGGINTYVKNLQSGLPSDQQIVEVERGGEAMTIHSLVQNISTDSSLVMHDPSFCRFLQMKFVNHLALVLHGNNPYYYSGIQEFGLLTDGIICVSGDIQSNISQRFQSKTITLGPSIKQRDQRTLKANKTGPLKLIFVAREDFNKGVQHLPIIDRTIIEHDLQPQWTIVLGSRPEEIQSFRVWARDHESRVTIQENIPNQTVPALIGQHDALILPSQTEGHPMVLIEALSQSIPPFSFYYSDHCENHLPVDPESIVGPSRNPEELAQRLLRHHQRSQEGLEQWQQAASEFVETHHNPSVQAQKLADFLASLPKRRKSPLKQRFYKWKRRILILTGAW